tara:strand:- start:14 stop:517 length:504 start_codon:yes stop_codon:yes gene_type:complete
MRIGQGYDAHKLIPGEGMMLGGIYIKSEFSIEAHSDGDVIIHAIIDSLLGAAALGDLGTHFPSDDPKYENISSSELLGEVIDLLSSLHYEIVNIDVTLVAEKPKVIDHIKAMKKHLCILVNIGIDDINIKATTTDGLGFEGIKLGISCYSVSLIRKVEPKGNRIINK